MDGLGGLKLGCVRGKGLSVSALGGLVVGGTPPTPREAQPMAATVASLGASCVQDHGLSEPSVRPHVIRLHLRPVAHLQVYRLARPRSERTLRE